MLVGVEPTGRTFEVQHIHMYRVLDGKIAEHLANRDYGNETTAWFATAASVVVRPNNLSY